MHPAHVPLEAEAEPARVRRPRDARPGGRLLGDHEHARLAPVHDLVQLLEERDRVEVLAAAVDVRDPLARLAASSRGRASRRRRRRGGRRRGTRASQKSALASEEVAHLGAAVVEDERAPVGMRARGAGPRARRARCRRSARARSRRAESAPAPSRGSRRARAGGARRRRRGSRRACRTRAVGA